MGKDRVVDLRARTECRGYEQGHTHELCLSGLQGPGTDGYYGQAPSGGFYEQGPISHGYSQGPGARGYGQGHTAGGYGQGHTAGSYVQGHTARGYGQGPMPPYVVLKSKGRKEECKERKRTMNTSDRQELTKEDISDVSLEVIQRGIKEGLMTHYLPCFF